MIDPRYQQRRLAEGFFAEEVEGWTEEWMKQADEVLEDEELIDLVYEALRQKELETMLARVRQVMRQGKERVFKGNTHVAGKIVSLFEPETETIRRGKASKPTEFGKMSKI